MTDDLLTRLRVEPVRVERPLGAELPPTTESVDPLRAIAGQHRAQDALAFGIAMTAEGYNIAVPGPQASGRSMVIHHLVDTAARAMPLAPDWVFLHNFADPRRPRAVSLPPATGDDLQRGMAEVVDACRHAIPRAFESESYSSRREQVLEPFGRARQERMEQMEQVARSRGFGLSATTVGLVPVPIDSEGNPIPPESFATLPEQVRDRLSRDAEMVGEAIQATLRDLRRIDLEARNAVEALDREAARLVLGPVLERLRADFGPHGLTDHLQAVEEDILSNLDTYRRFSESAAGQVPPQLLAQAIEERENRLRRYAVNLFVSHGDEPADGAPVIDERHHGYHNLFGWIDYESRMGSMVTDFTRIHPGAIHRANGGFLVLQVQDLFTDPRSWAKLKRTLRTREARLDDPAEWGLPFPVAGLQPEGVPVDLKVIISGPPLTFALLDAVDPEFEELFKIRAEFEPDVPADADNIASYVAFVRRTVDECSLLHFDAPALEAVIREGSRLAGRQDRLSARYGMTADLCHEANQIARAAGAAMVTGEHVARALEARRSRSSLVPDRLRTMIAEGTLHIETSGSVVGQVNGLAVYGIGGHLFGTPTRITCRVGAGRSGVVAIERETERSGAIHTKGVLVLSGYLQGTFGTRQPLTFTASLTFEQSYEEVEGDSASSAELVAILTSLAGVAIRQDIAVTGSIDQFGNIQPVGGVTHKVEGFFDVCREVGLTGTQGVVIPASNVINLTLRPDVTAAIRQGRFHVWAVRRVEETVEILSGVPAGTLDPNGLYPAGSVYRRVADALDRMSREAAKQAAG